MSSNPGVHFDGLKLTERVKTLSRTAHKHQTIRDQIQTGLEAKRQEVLTLSARINILTKVGELFRLLMDKLVNGQVRTVEGIVTEGLKAVFFDQDLALESEVSQKYNKIAIDFLIRQGEGPMAVRGKPLECFGGGPATVASLIIRVMTLLRLKRWPVLLLDESLAAVSDDYIDPTGGFLRKLADSAHIDVLLVTHKPAFLEHAKVAYQGVEEPLGDDGWCLSLKRIRDPA